MTENSLFALDELARFSRELRYRDIPDDVKVRAKELILDSVGIQISSAATPWVRAIYRYVRTQGTNGPCTIARYGDKVSVLDASLFNGVAAHGFELDDMQPGAGVHCGCVVVPAAVALGELFAASGRDIILWVTIGVEIMARIGLATAPSMLWRGHHGTGVVGPIAAGAVGARAMDLSQSQTVDAMAIGAFQGCGLLHGTISGGALKRLSGGLGASNGIKAALLAQSGTTGPSSILEGELGLGVAFSDEFNPQELVRGLNDTWHLLNTRFKIYAQDGFIQPMTDAIRIIKKEHDVNVDDIETVRIGTSRFARTITGTIVEPVDIPSAQFSAVFSVALYLVKGDAGIVGYTDANLWDPKVREVSRRIELVVDEEIDSRGMRSRSADVQIVLRSGKELRYRVDELRTLSSLEVEDKFMTMLSAVVCDEFASKLKDRILGLESEDVANDVFEMLRLPGPLTMPSTKEPRWG